MTAQMFVLNSNKLSNSSDSLLVNILWAHMKSPRLLRRWRVGKSNICSLVAYGIDLSPATHLVAPL
jgi:hypothetical protein